ncbi:hypothetical protein HQ576_00680 [bacterium]|nr:hypothetical protein [bacterium]
MEERIVEFDHRRNPEYAGVLTEQSELSLRSNELNKKLREFARPLARVGRARRQLREIGKGIADLQTEYQEWFKRANELSIKPRARFSPQADQLASFLHLNDLLRDRITRLHWNMKTLESNYEIKRAKIDDQRNLLLALFGLAVSLVGLGLSLTAVSCREKPPRRPEPPTVTQEGPRSKTTNPQSTGDAERAKPPMAVTQKEPRTPTPKPPKAATQR